MASWNETEFGWGIFCVLIVVAALPILAISNWTIFFMNESSAWANALTTAIFFLTGSLITNRFQFVFLRTDHHGQSNDEKRCLHVELILPSLLIGTSRCSSLLGSACSVEMLWMH